jgi:hypothetical protein
MAIHACSPTAVPQRSIIARVVMRRSADFLIERRVDESVDPMEFIQQVLKEDYQIPEQAICLIQLFTESDRKYFADQHPF